MVKSIVKETSRVPLDACLQETTRGVILARAQTKHVPRPAAGARANTDDRTNCRFPRPGDEGRGYSRSQGMPARTRRALPYRPYYV